MYVRTVEENKRLIDKYPWLMPRNVWTNEPIEDYDYSYTWLDDMPNGWNIAFGELICEEINNELIKMDYVDKYQIVQIKEKFGELRWYDNGHNDEISKIIDAYSTASVNICQTCGKIDSPISNGYWIYTQCKECYESNNIHSKPFEEEFDMDYTTMQNSYSYNKYNKDTESWDKYTVDISNTINKIRKRYYNEHRGNTKFTD